MKERAGRQICLGFLVSMWDLWPCSFCYRAYFGTMKFRQRLFLCSFLLLIIIPFIYLRFRLADVKHPLASASDTYDRRLHDRTDLNNVDHRLVQRSSDKDGVVESNVKSEEKTNLEPKIENERDADDMNGDSPDYQFDDPWQLWKEMVTDRQLSSRTDPDSINMILEALTFKPIVAVGVGYKGTQLKATMLLEGKQRVVFKPMRYPRNHIIEGKPYDGFDRHNGEIAAFHLDRILGFYRAPPVAGRVVNLEEEVEPIGDMKLMNTFFKEKGNTCFYGVCYYCKKAEAACANGTQMEGSVTIWLPQGWTLAKSRHPWQRTYTSKKAQWEKDKNFCKKVIQTPPYNSGPRLLDVIDTAVFDFFIGNADRHHYETFKKGEDKGMLIHLDNGKSFANPRTDELSILAPLYQCCKIRASTWTRLSRIYSDAKKPLSKRLEKAMEKDAVAPVLTKLHLKALDRRLKIVVDVIKRCIRKNNQDGVLLKDGL